MVKLVSLMKRKDGMSRQEFALWAVEEHAKIGPRLPGIREYRISVLRADQADADYDGVFEMWFDTMEALQSALDSPTGAEAREDAMANASVRKHLRVDEHVLLRSNA